MRHSCIGFGRRVFALLAAAWLIVGIAACKTKAPTETTDATVLPADAPDLPPAPPAPPAPPVQPDPDQQGTRLDWPAAEELVVSLQTTPCLGTCPVYRLEVFRDGTLRYTGSQFTERIGTYRGKIAASRLQALLEQAETMRFSDMASVYPTGEIRIMDLPSSIFYLRTDTWQKQVVSRGYANPDVEGEQVIVDQLREFKSVIEGLLEGTPLQLVGEGLQH